MQPLANRFAVARMATWPSRRRRRSASWPCSGTGRDADAGSDLDGQVLDDEGSLEQTQDLVADAPGQGHVRARQQHSELFPAQAGDVLRLSEHVSQPLRELADDQVAVLVAEGVVLHRGSGQGQDEQGEVLPVAAALGEGGWKSRSCSSSRFGRPVSRS